MDEKTPEEFTADLWKSEQARIIQEHTSTIAWWMTRAEQLEVRSQKAENKLAEVKGFAEGLVNDHPVMDERNFQVYHALIEILEGGEKE
jgi:hypothetical protein